MTQEERRAAFHQKAEIGNKRNNACLDIEKSLLKRIGKDLSVHEAITLAWAAGCDYGKEHAEELMLFDTAKLKQLIDKL